MASIKCSPTKAILITNVTSAALKAAYSSGDFKEEPLDTLRGEFRNIVEKWDRFIGEHAPNLENDTDPLELPLTDDEFAAIAQTLVTPFATPHRLQKVIDDIKRDSYPVGASSILEGSNPLLALFAVNAKYLTDYTSDDGTMVEDDDVMSLLVGCLDIAESLLVQPA